MRINKFLASAGLGSRRKVEELVTSGAISVNGVVTKDLATDIKEGDIVKYLNRVVTMEEAKVYYMLHKPKKVLSSCGDGHGRRLVTDFVPFTPKVFPIGRLDYDTEGLILLTNDGDFANSIIHPRMHIPKTYEITTNKKLSIDDKRKLENGVEIDGRVTLPAKITTDIVIKTGYSRKITIFEGRNRQIRKMFDSIGHCVVSLKRLSIGGLQLGNLPSGKYTILSNKDIEKVFEIGVN